MGVQNNFKANGILLIIFFWNNTYGDEHLNLLILSKQFFIPPLIISYKQGICQGKGKKDEESCITEYRISMVGGAYSRLKMGFR